MPDLWIVSACLPLLGLAASIDARTHRIPNAVVVIGISLGLGVNILAPTGLGAGGSILGLIVALVTFLPFFLLRAMGAGDVKLFAMVGSFLGVSHLIGAVLATLLAGGVLSLAIAWRAGRLRQMFSNIRLMLFGLVMRVALAGAPTVEPPAPAARMPYGVAIAIGTGTYLLWLHARGGWL